MVNTTCRVPTFGHHIAVCQRPFCRASMPPRQRRRRQPRTIAVTWPRCGDFIVIAAASPPPCRCAHRRFCSGRRSVVNSSRHSGRCSSHRRSPRNRRSSRKHQTHTQPPQQPQQPQPPAVAMHVVPMVATVVVVSVVVAVAIASIIVVVRSFLVYRQ